MDVTKVDISVIVGHTCEISLFFALKANALFGGLRSKNRRLQLCDRTALLPAITVGSFQSLRAAATRVWTEEAVVVVHMTKVPMAQEEAHHHQMIY